eukprot:7991630-Heterocapsa_arctica.AAC.1
MEEGIERERGPERARKEEGGRVSRKYYLCPNIYSLEPLVNMKPMFMESGELQYTVSRNVAEMVS